MPRPRALLVDDHDMIVQSFRVALADHLDIVGSLRLGAEVRDAVQRLRPDVVLLDLGLPDRSGLEVIGELHADCPGCKILVVTMHADRILADAAFQSGAHGYVPKDAGIAELVTAVGEVLAGRRFLSDMVPRRPSHRADPGNPAFGLGRLTARQQQIVRLLADGRSTVQIAEALGLSTNTVTFHRVRIRKALGLKNEFELQRYAIVVRMSEMEVKP
jgi:DNA-binding NarL/FixJ family response regulator